ncbi:MAG: DUF58 domain-containing protein [Aeriscardovia sp.]|nr:DUF58 domain-containing protein [Aeriscardovia sp.]
MSQKDPLRAKIEAFGSRLSLPTAIKTLGSLEGEHASRQKGGGYDYSDLRPYEPGESVQFVDWKASGRSGRPIVVNKQREVTSTLWLILDASAQMGGTARGRETLLTVAANALRMFAAVSLKRSDDISLVLADSQTISRIPFNGGYQKFDSVLEAALKDLKPAERDFTSLLQYVQGIRQSKGLIVIATDDGAMDSRHEPLIASISQRHTVIFISVEPINPFDPDNQDVQDASSGRYMPSFLQSKALSREIDARSEVLSNAFERALVRHGDVLLRAGSSEEMLSTFIHFVGQRLRGPKPQRSSLLRS